MLILTLKTDQPEAEIGLYDAAASLTQERWEAHRRLAETIHAKINELLTKEQKTLKDLKGIVIFQGPGSFTGLRIGFSVANALADSLQIPVIATKGEQWANDGIQALLAGKGTALALPEYGAEANTTTPRK